MQKPKIAIMMDENTSKGATHYELSKGFVALVTRYGGRPYGLFYDNDTPENIAADFDGLIMAGGYARLPQEWFLEGQSPLHPASQRVAFEIALASAFFTLKKPILGVCHGAQILAGMLGGTLCNDVSPALHKNTDHDVIVTPGSMLHGIVRALDLPVNSRHGEAVYSVSDKFTISAYSQDKVIEAIEAKNHPFAIGIQWHQEDFADNANHPGNLLFKALVDASAQRKP